MNWENKITLLLMVAGGFAASLAAAQTPLRLREAVETALRENPSGKQAQAEQALSAASLQQAKASLLPQFQLEESITRGNDPVYAFGTRLRQQSFTAADFALNALNRPALIGNFATRLSGQWMVFDSLARERRIEAAKKNVEASIASQKNVDQQVILAVVQGYESVLYAARQLLVTRHEEATATALQGSVDERVQAGLAVESDRMAAVVSRAARQQERIAAEGELDLAWAQLRLAMGTPEAPIELLQPIEAHRFTIPALAEQLSTALKNRPDLQSLHAADAAQKQNFLAARSALGPQIAAFGTVEENRGSITSSGGHNWLAGAEIRLDLQPLGKRAEWAAERAKKSRIEAQAAACEQMIRLQIAQARTHLAVAAQSMATTHAVLDQATESLRIIQNRYQAGLATITDLLRAEDAERESQSMYWQAVYQNAMAYAENLYATGTLTPEATETLQ